MNDPAHLPVTVPGLAAMPGPARLARRGDADKAPLVLRMLMFGMGLMLPLISLSRERGLSMALTDRVAYVDILCALTVCVLLLTGRFRIHATQVVYFLALLLSLAIGIAFVPGLGSVTAWAALVMAALYLVVGESIAGSPALVRALLAGMIAGVLGEAVIVMHDFFLPKWFLDRHPDRVRGTFRASGQLAQYGFTVAGILLSFGWTFYRRNKTRVLVVLTGFLAAFFVLAAARRSGMFALLAWVGLFLLLGLRATSRRAYMAVLFISLVGLAALLLRTNEEGESYIVERFVSGVELVSSGDSFIHQQFHLVMSNIPVWLPLGTGAGGGHLALERDGVIPFAEIHNGHLALVVELGLLGLVAFYILCARALLRRWQPPLAGPSPARAVRVVFVSFMLAAAVFMIHNRLHRDRGFALLLGLAPSVSITAGLAGSRRRGPMLPRGAAVQAAGYLVHR